MTTSKRMSPEFAQELGVVFGQGADYWLNLDNAYRLSQTEYVDEEVVRRSRLFSFPIKDMQKRRWINETLDVNELESELERFFGEGSVDAEWSGPSSYILPFVASYKRTNKELALNNAEKAWIARARQLARALPITAAFKDQNVEALERDLRRFAAKSQAVLRVPELLARYGIRFVVIEPLPRVKIDGAAFWLDENSPVIAMSLRYDNIGSFWYALIHEVKHIKHRDAFSFDNLEVLSSEDESEIRASKEAADLLVPEQELEKFIKTYKPRYTEARINNLATKVQVHPGIIVGQLQFRKEISYAAHRKLMPKIRELATTIAFTDGWGRPVPQV
jgi:HTH-type transcriptional regulator / antitoxin HigA